MLVLVCAEAVWGVCAVWDGLGVVWLGVAAAFGVGKFLTVCTGGGMLCVKEVGSMAKTFLCNRCGTEVVQTAAPVVSCPSCERTFPTVGCASLRASAVERGPTHLVEDEGTTALPLKPVEFVPEPAPVGMVGWRCPKCGRGNAPWVMCCQCGPDVRVTFTSDTQQEEA